MMRLTPARVFIMILLATVLRLDLSSPPFAGDFSPDYEAHANAVFDVKWLPSGTTFLTASGDQSCRLLDTERGTIVKQFFGHTMSVRSLALMPQDTNVFVSASRDGSIRLWDMRLKSDTVNFQGNPGTSSIGLISQCHVPNWSSMPDVHNPTTRRLRAPSKRGSSDAQSVTSVIFMNDNTLLSAGSTDGSIKMWDLRRLFSVNNKKCSRPKCVLPYRGISQKRSGYSDLQVDSNRTRLFANCLDNVIYEYDLTKPSTCPTFVYTGHKTNSFYIKLDVSPDDNYLVCGSSDSRAHIYAIGQSRQRPVALSGHNGEVSVPRWCRADPTRLVTLSDDSKAFVWNMFPARASMLPLPGEITGLAERLSSPEVLMSPSEQHKRILRSPCFMTNQPEVVNNDFTIPGTTSPMLAVMRRRQSNIRHFLEALSPPLTGIPSNHHPISPSVIEQNKPRGTLTTLTKTLGGVVQRFPGSTVGFSSGPCGGTGLPLAAVTDASEIVIDKSKSPITPLQKTVKPRDRRYLGGTEPQQLFDYQSDTENVDPTTLDGTSQFSRLGPTSVGKCLHTCTCNCCSHRNLETPPTSARRAWRTPLTAQQALSQTAPRSSMGLGDASKKRMTAYDRSPPVVNGSPVLTTPRLHQQPSPTNPVASKRRRLTCYAVHEASTSRVTTDASGTPRTPISRRRRMTTIDQRMLKPITQYFKLDDE